MQKNQIQDGEDLIKIINYSIDLFKTEWPDNEYASNLTGDLIIQYLTVCRIFVTIIFWGAHSKLPVPLQLDRNPYNTSIQISRSDFLGIHLMPCGVVCANLSPKVSNLFILFP